MHRFWAYLHLWYADRAARLLTCPDLAGLLLVAARTPMLVDDATAMGLTWVELGGGYSKLVGGPFALYVGEIDAVADTEHDDELHLFGRVESATLEAKRWLWAHASGKEMNMDLHEMEGFDEIMQKFVQTLTPEQRLAGLTPEQMVLGLPDEVLRGFSDEYLATLSPETRAKIRLRIGR